MWAVDLKRLRTLLIKEFQELWQQKAILFIAAWSFTGAIYSAGHGMSMDIVNYPVMVYDLSRTAYSRELISRIQKPYFKFLGYVHGDRELEERLNRGYASAVVIIPPEFGRALSSRQAQIQVVTDGTQTQSATMASGYLGQIIGRFAQEHAQANVVTTAILQIPGVDSRDRIAFNPNTISAWFSTMLELSNQVAMIAMLLTAAAMVREKERGTLDQLLVSPMRPAELFVAKIIPTMVVVVIGCAVALGLMVHLVFHVPVRGNLLLFFSVLLVHVFAVSSLGLYLALLANGLGQAMMLLLLVLFPMMFLSGAFTPPESMVPWMRYGSLLSPLRHFMDFSYQVVFKGNGIAYVWKDILGILGVGFAVFMFSVRRYLRLFS